MGTVSEKLNYLNGTKAAIKAAIEAKGVEVSDSATFRSFANFIAAIPSGAADVIVGTVELDVPAGENSSVVFDKPLSGAPDVAALIRIGGIGSVTAIDTAIAGVRDEMPPMYTRNSNNYRMFFSYVTNSPNGSISYSNRYINITIAGTGINNATASGFGVQAWQSLKGTYLYFAAKLRD